MLREDLDITDGLADDRVIVLDPCCGTGAYLVEALRLIADRLERQGVGSLTGADLKAAAMDRIFGFELLTAPFVVAHLQIGLFLRAQGVPFATEDEAASESAERAGVYLTNALTGWDPAEDPQRSIFPELDAERDAADEIKQEKKILVVLGNPPYDGYAGMAVGEESALTDEYRETGDAAPDPSGQGLNDLYVRFFRIAERQIAEQTGRGVVCYISNYSWLDGLSHPGMRERYLNAFDRVWIDNLHGDRKISERAPGGRSSETVFKIKGQSPGIRVGTSIALLARTDGGGARDVQYRDFHQPRAEERRKALLESSEETSHERAGVYTALVPRAGLGYPLKPRVTGEGYFDWPKLKDLFPMSFPGVKTSRDAALVDIDRDRLASRMKRYFDLNISNAEIAKTDPSLMSGPENFDAKETRQRLQKRGFKAANIIRYQHRPMDIRWLYWETDTDLLDRERDDYLPHVFEGNVWMSITKRVRKKPFYKPQLVRSLADMNVIEANVQMVPIKLNPNPPVQDLFSQPGTRSDNGNAPNWNQSDGAVNYLADLSPPDNPTAEDLFFHTLAVLHAPAYRAENEGALRQDWPRVPLPAEADALRQSAALGGRVAALLDVEQEVDGVTAGSVRDELRPIAAPVKADGTQLDPSVGDLAVTAGWGYTIGTTVMPNKGEIVERPFTEDEQHAFPEGYEDRFGAQALDLYLNKKAYWQDVPQRVWDYTLGGYPVLKKWLSYREEDVLGRALRTGEVRHFAGMARRIASLLLLEPELDENYVRARSEAVAWEEVATS